MSITQNTNKDWLPLPMLAERLDKVSNVPKEGHIQRKLNGVRCIAMFIDNEVVLCSRGGGYYEIPHISAELKTTVFKDNPHVILDGEVYKHGVPLQTISGAVRRERKDMFDQKTWLQYHIYDVVSQDMQIDRLNVLDDVLTYIESTEHVIRVQSTYVDNAPKMWKIHDQFVQEGYEGAIFRPDGGMYESGFRSNDLIKLKNYIDAEFEIIGYKVDDNQSIGDSFVFRLLNDINSLYFYARPTGTRAMKEYWFSNMKQLIGKRVTVRFQERSDDGLPTQGHVRSDISKLPIIEIIND